METTIFALVLACIFLPVQGQIYFAEDATVSFEPDDFKRSFIKSECPPGYSFEGTEECVEILDGNNYQ